MRNLTVRNTRIDIVSMIQFLRSEPLGPGETERQREKLLQDLNEAQAASAHSRKLWRVKSQPARRRA